MRLTDRLHRKLGKSAQALFGTSTPAIGVAGSRSPFAIIWIFAAIVLCVLVFANASFGLLSSARAYVGGESLWSKAQKDAVFHLQQYAISRDPAELRAFRVDLATPLGDREARIEMNKPTPNIDRVRRGFIAGGIHPDDINGMIQLYRRFGGIDSMRRAIRTWEQGDRYIADLNEAGNEIEREVKSPSPRAQAIRSILADVSRVNATLTPIENQFVDALSASSRTTYRVLQAAIFTAIPALLLMGVALSMRILQQRKRTESRLIHITLHDDLTSLPNRLMFNRSLEQALSRHRRAGTEMAILLMDLDRFKVINDSLGHEIGDELLRRAADRLQNQCREGDMVARMGGDEFAVLMENQDNLAHISMCAQRFIDEMSAPYTLKEKDCSVTVSVGISVFPTDGGDSQALLKAADVAMYRAKEGGRNNYLYYSPKMNVHTLERLELESDLRHALEQGQFLLHYQPKVELATGLITGVEALLRWKHPRRGIVPPKDFISLAEETGLIVPIGEWALATACARTKDWQDQGFANFSVAVNLSARQFADPMLLPKLTRIISGSGLRPSSVELEITESMVMSHRENAVAVLESLKSIGVQIALDDFGTGYSSLAYLKRFPIDSIKIDRSFIQDIPADSDDKKITRAIIAMAHSMRLKVVAEGVETAAQLSFLRTQCCDAVQGYFLHRPLPDHAVASLLDLNRRGLADRTATPA